MSAFLEFSKKYKPVVESSLDKYLTSEETYPQTIHKAMRYSISAGGKRLRPLLTMAASQLACGEVEPVLPTACAMEIIHTYSLIHDDLPCMDNDDFRRGKPTLHKVTSEAIAVLAGDALLTFAFELIAANAEIEGVIKANIPDVIKEIAIAAGSLGMVGGQTVDIELEGKEFDVPTLQYLHTHKTGALITASLTSGALLVSKSPKIYNSLKKYGHKIGLAFQIVDDILDITSDQETLGKTVMKDIHAKKATYPAVFEVEESRKLAQELLKEAKHEIKSFGEKADVLSSLADYILERTY